MQKDVQQGDVDDLQNTYSKVPDEALETIYSNKSTELSHIVRNLQKDALTESL